MDPVSSKAGQSCEPDRKRQAAAAPVQTGATARADAAAAAALSQLQSLQSLAPALEAMAKFVNFQLGTDIHFDTPQYAFTITSEDRATIHGAVDALLLLFKDYPTAQPITRQHMLMLNLHVVVNISIIALMVRMKEDAAPAKCTPASFQPLLSMLILDPKNSQYKWVTAPPDTLKKLFNGLAKGLELKPEVYQHLINNLQVLADQKKYYLNILDDTPLDANNNLPLLQLCGTLIQKASRIIFPVCKNLFNSTRALSERESDKKSRGDNTDLDKANQKMFKHYQSSYQMLHGYALSRLQQCERGCKRSKRELNSNQQVYQLAALCSGTAKVFAKHTNTLLTSIRNQEKYLSLVCSKHFSDHSKRFLEESHREILRPALMFFLSLKITYSTPIFATEAVWPETDKTKKLNRFVGILNILAIDVEIAMYNDDKRIKPRVRENVIRDLQQKKSKEIETWKQGIPEADQKWIDAFDFGCQSHLDGFSKQLNQAIDEVANVCPELQSSIKNTFMQHRESAFFRMHVFINMIRDQVQQGKFVVPYDSVGLVKFLEFCHGCLTTSFSKTEYIDRFFRHGTVPAAEVYPAMAKHVVIANKLTELSSLINVVPEIFSHIVDPCKEADNIADVAEAADEAWQFYVDIEADDANEGDSKSAAAVVPESPSSPLNLSLVKRSAAPLPYPHGADRMLGRLRHRLAILHKQPDHVVMPQTVLGKNPPFYDNAVNQQFFLLDCLHSVSEMIHGTRNVDTQRFLLKSFRVYENLLIEQVLSAAYAQLHPEDEPLHDMQLLFQSLRMDAKKYVSGAYTKGTIPDRYPHSVPPTLRPRTLSKEADVKAASDSITARVAELQSIYATVFSEDEQKWDADASTASPKQEKYGFNEDERKQFAACREGLVKVLATVNGESNALRNVRYHLSNLIHIADAIQEFPQLRFLSAFANMALFSTQYLAENLGIHLSILSDAELHTHHLQTYCETFRLGEGLSADHLKTLREIDVGKGSEYPFTYFGRHKGDQVSLLMLSQGGIYAASRIARHAYEAGTALTEDPKATYHDFSQQVVRMMQLSTALINLHIHSPR